MRNLLITATLAILSTAGLAFAQDGPTGVQKARQGQFQILALNLGILGSMVKGEVEYDAEKAGAAADSIVAVSQIHQDPLWPEGSGTDVSPHTRALPAIWAEPEGFAQNWRDLGAAAVALQTAAGEGAGALGPALGRIGGVCSACHEDYRAPDT